MTDARTFSGATGNSVTIAACACGVRHVRLLPGGVAWEVTLQPDDAVEFARWLKAPTDAVEFGNTGGPEGDAFSRVRAQVVPTLEGERHVGLTLQCADDRFPLVVRLPFDAAREMAEYIDAVALPPPQTSGVFARVNVPDAYALQLTLRGEQLRWFSHALSALCTALAEVHPGVTGLSREQLISGLVYDIPRHAKALNEFLTASAAVYDVLEQAAAQLRAEGKIP